MGNDNYKWETYKLGGRGGQHALAQQMEFVSLICHHASDKNIIIYIHNTHPQQVGRKSMFCRVSVRVPFRILVRGGSERGTLGSGHIGVRSIHNVIRKRKKEKICCTQDGFFWTNSAIFPKSVLLSVFFFLSPPLSSWVCVVVTCMARRLCNSGKVDLNDRPLFGSENEEGGGGVVRADFPRSH